MDGEDGRGGDGPLVPDAARRAAAPEDDGEGLVRLDLDGVRKGDEEGEPGEHARAEGGRVDGDSSVAVEVGLEVAGEAVDGRVDGDVEVEFRAAFVGRRVRRPRAGMRELEALLDGAEGRVIVELDDEGRLQASVGRRRADAGADGGRARGLARVRAARLKPETTIFFTDAKTSSVTLKVPSGLTFLS